MEKKNQRNDVKGLSRARARDPRLASFAFSIPRSTSVSIPA
jgi:hypothetical protein